MTCVILVGDDAVSLRSRRAELIAAAAADPAQAASYDLADPEQLYPALTAIGQPSMFAEPRLITVRGLEDLDAPGAQQLRQALMGAQPTDTVVLTGTRLPAAAKRELVGVTIETFNAATGSARARISTLASDQGLVLDTATLDHLEAVTGGDLAAVSSVLYAFTMTGITHPNATLIDRFAGGHATRSGTPWGVADALATGDLRTALALADGCEPLAVLAYLGTRIGQLGRIVETPLNTAAEVAGAFGVPNITGAQRLLDHAHRLGGRGVADSWQLIAAADVAVKRSTAPRVTLDVVLVKVARTWARVTPQVDTVPAPAPRGLPAPR